MARDPFSWANDFAQTQHSRAAQDSALAQNTLMNVFTQEARRQAPWSDLPTDLAKQQNQYDLSLRNSTSVAQMKADMKPGLPAGKIANVIKASAKAYGLDPDIMVTLADIETGGTFNPKAYNKSGASGLFQFMPGTAEQYGLADPFDAVTNTDAAMRLTRDNARALERAGIPVNAGTIYLAHQQGAGGATKLLTNPNARAEDIVGRAAVLQNGGRPGMSAGAFAEMWMGKANRLYKARAEQRAKGRGQLVDYDLGDGTSLDLAGLDKPLGGDDDDDDDDAGVL